MTAEAPFESISSEGMIGKIPVRNIWLLMLYASDLFRVLDDAHSGVEEKPDEIPDLVAEILCHHVEHRIKRNLSFGYRSREENLNRVRGRIDVLHTRRHRLLDRGKVACRFDELTVDTPRNRYVRAALDKISGIVGRRTLSQRCRSLSLSLARMGVSSEKPNPNEVSNERFGQHDAGDRPMVAAARLAFDLALPTEEWGRRLLAAPDRDIVWMRKLYEKAVAGFYSVALSSTGWKVLPGKSIGWQIQRKTGGIERILPKMRTDIVLESAEQNRRIVIDTKFNSLLAKGWYRDETIRSGYVYQIYAYLRSQEKDEDRLSQNSVGLLLHPAVGGMMNESVWIQNHEIRFATVDLAASTVEIRKQLEEVASLWPQG